MIRTDTHRAVYIPEGCDQQGRTQTGVYLTGEGYIRERTQQAAEAATELGAEPFQEESRRFASGLLVALVTMAGIAALALCVHGWRAGWFA